MLYFLYRNKPYCIVESQFISEGPDELTIQPGDKVMLIERINEDWLKGTLKEKIGIFPSAFVDIKTDLSMPSKQPAYESISKYVCNQVKCHTIIKYGST